jgi:hypothetical protein
MAEAPVDPAAEEDKKKEEMVAASALLRLTGASNLAAAVVQAAAYRESHIALETERQKLATERAILEASERRKGCLDLVVKAGRAPSTVWADSDCSAPKSYLANMPMADFRDYVADALKSAPKTASKAPSTTPIKASQGQDFVTPHGVVTLSASELESCAETGAKPEDYAANKAVRDSQRTSRGGK